MADFAIMLGRRLDSNVVDATGLTGEYDLKLEWAPDTSQSGGASLFTAVQEQLGFKLESKKTAVDVVVIDGMQPLGEN